MTEDSGAPCSDREGLGRRAFLRTAAAAIVAAASGEWWRRAWRHGGRPIAPFLVPQAARLEIGQAVDFKVPGNGVAGLIARVADDVLVAVDRRCPHLGCPVMWSQTSRQFECPCHRAAFDARTGEVLEGPPPRGLRRFEIETRGAEVWLRHGGAEEKDEIA